MLLELILVRLEVWLLSHEGGRAVLMPSSFAQLAPPPPSAHCE